AGTIVAVAVARFTLVSVCGTPFRVDEHVRLARTKSVLGCSVIVTCELVVPNTYSLNCRWLLGRPVCAFTPPSCTSVKVGGSSGPVFPRLGLVVVKLKGQGPYSGLP